MWFNKVIALTFAQRMREIHWRFIRSYVAQNYQGGEFQIKFCDEIF